MMMRFNKIQIIAGLIVLLCLLVIADVMAIALQELTGHDNLLGFSRLFSFHEESNIPTFFSSFLLGGSAVLLLMLYSLKRTRPEKYYWLSLAFIFLFLSIDEFAQLHEFIGSLISRTQAQNLLPTPTSSSWVLWGGIMVVVVIIVFWKFWINLAKDIRLLFFLAAFSYVGGALFFEIFEIYYIPLFGIDIGFYILSTLEETMEIVGVIIFIYALLKQIILINSTITIVFY